MACAHAPWEQGAEEPQFRLPHEDMDGGWGVAQHPEQVHYHLRDLQVVYVHNR